ncbi:MAG: DUF3892 domain-containing protein [Thermomicrobiales bacterium]
MALYVVTATRRRSSSSSHDSISHLEAGVRLIPVGEVIQLINAGHRFVVLTSSGPEVAPFPDTRVGPHVRSHANGKWTDNLLSLPIK